MKLSGLHKFLFYIFVVDSLHVFLPPLEFSIIIAFQFCLCENVRLFHTWSQIISTLPVLSALWLSCDWNCELCQSASQVKEDIWCTLEELRTTVKGIPTHTIGRYFLWWRVPNLEKSEYFGTYSSKTIQKIFINSGLTNIPQWQSDSFTAPYTAVYGRRNRMSMWIKVYEVNNSLQYQMF